MSRERAFEMLLADGVDVKEAASFAGVEVPVRYGVASVATIGPFEPEDYRVLQMWYRHDKARLNRDLTSEEKFDLRERVKASRCVRWMDRAPAQSSGSYPRTTPPGIAG